MALRQLFLSRNIHSFKTLRATLAEPLESHGEHANSYKKWKKLFFFACCPCILIAYVNVALEEPPSRPEYVEYPYLRIRNKKFPWRDGVKTVFHNPYYNALPGGYEENAPPPHHSWLYTLVKGSKH